MQLRNVFPPYKEKLTLPAHTSHTDSATVHSVFLESSEVKGNYSTRWVRCDLQSYGTNKAHLHFSEKH